MRTVRVNRKLRKGESHFQSAVFIVGFVLLFFFSLSQISTISGLENKKLDDLAFSPDLGQGTELDLSLENDSIASDNIEWDDNISDPDYSPETGLRLYNLSEKGVRAYRVPLRAEAIETRATKWGLLNPSGIQVEFYETLPELENLDSTSPIKSYYLKGSQNWAIPEDANSMVFRFTKDRNDAVLYEADYYTSQSKGLIGTTTELITEATNTVINFIELVTGLPENLSVIRTFLIVIAGLVALEIILW